MSTDLSIDPLFQQVRSAGVSALTEAATTLLGTGSGEVAASVGNLTMNWLPVISLGASIIQAVIQNNSNQNRAQEDTARERRTEELLERNARRNESNLSAFAQEARNLLEAQTKNQELALLQSEQRQTQARAWEAVNAVMNDLYDRISLYRDCERKYFNDPSSLVEETKIFQRDIEAFLKKLSNAMLRGLIDRNALHVWINAAAFHIQMISCLADAGIQSTETHRIAVDIHRETARNLFSAYKIHNQHATALGEIMEAETSFHSTFNKIEYPINRSVSVNTSQTAGFSNQIYDLREQHEPSRHSSRSCDVDPPARRSTRHLGRTFESDPRGKQRFTQGPQKCAAGRKYFGVKRESQKKHREPLDQQQHYEGEHISSDKQGHRGMHDHDKGRQEFQEAGGRRSTRARQQPSSQKNQERRPCPHNHPESSENSSSSSTKQTRDWSERSQLSRSSSGSSGVVSSATESAPHLGRTCRSDPSGKQRHSQDPQKRAACRKHSRNQRESRKTHRKTLDAEDQQKLYGTHHPSRDQQQPYERRNISCGKQSYRVVHNHDGSEPEREETDGRGNARARAQPCRPKYQERRRPHDIRPESSEESSFSSDEQRDWSEHEQSSRSSSRSSGAVPSASESTHHLGRTCNSDPSRKQRYSQDTQEFSACRKHSANRRESQKTHRQPLDFEDQQKLQGICHPSRDEQQPYERRNISCGKQGYQGRHNHDGSELEREETDGRGNACARAQPCRPKYQERRRPYDSRPESSEESSSSSDEQTKDWSKQGQPLRSSSRSSGSVPSASESESKSTHDLGRTCKSDPRDRQRYLQDPQEGAAGREHYRNKRESPKTHRESLNVEYQQKLQRIRHPSRDQQQRHEGPYVVSFGKQGHRRMHDHDGSELERQGTGGRRNARAGRQPSSPKCQERRRPPDNRPESSEESSSSNDKQTRDWSEQDEPPRSSSRTSGAVPSASQSAHHLLHTIFGTPPPPRSSSRTSGAVPSASQSVHHLGNKFESDPIGKQRYLQDPQKCTASRKHPRNKRESH